MLMFCPRCGQERVSRETSFCSRCGYLLTATADLLLTDGVPGPGFAMQGANPETGTESPRWRGVKQGLFVILLTIILAPLFGLILRFGLNMMPWPLGVFIFLFGGAGLLRVAYALMFEPKYGSGLKELAESRKPGLSGAAATTRHLSEGETSSYIPPNGVMAGRWADTNDLEPHSVTEPTTKLLEKEKD